MGPLMRETVGGSDKYRDYWKNFLHDTNLLMFVVDSSNLDLLPEVKTQLLFVLEHKELQGIPFLLVFTKADIKTSLSKTELLDKLGVVNIKDRKVESINIQLKCGGAPKSEGVNELQEKIRSLCLV